MLDFERFWSVPVYLPYVQPELTDEILAEAEAKLGVTLPEILVAALRVQNGGSLRSFQHESDDHNLFKSISGIGPHFPSLLEQPRPGLIELCGDGHYAYCLDYRDRPPTAEPTVVFVDFEQGFEEVLAQDLATFLSELEPHDLPFRGLVTGDLPVEEVVAALEAATGVTFTDQGAMGGGYQVYFARLQESPPENIFLTANRSPRGFARPDERGADDPRRHEIVHRYPEYPTCSWLLSGWEDFRGELYVDFLERVEAVPFDIVTIREPFVSGSLEVTVASQEEQDDLVAQMRALGIAVSVPLPLNSPKWATLSHAHGSAADVPELLEALAAVEDMPQSWHEEPLFSIWDALVHQGDVAIAGFAAAPHLVSMIWQRPLEQRPALLHLVGAIATGDPSVVEDDLRLSFEACCGDASEQCGETLFGHPLSADEVTALLADLAALNGHGRAARAVARLVEGELEVVCPNCDAFDTFGVTEVGFDPPVALRDSEAIADANQLRAQEWSADSVGGILAGTAIGLGHHSAASQLASLFADTTCSECDASFRIADAVIV